MLVRDSYAPEIFTSQLTTDEHVIIKNRWWHSHNVLIRPIAYDAVYDNVVVPAQKLKEVQKEINGLEKIKVTRKMNPADNRMNTESRSDLEYTLLLRLERMHDWWEITKVNMFRCKQKRKLQ